MSLCVGLCLWFLLAALPATGAGAGPAIRTAVLPFDNESLTDPARFEPFRRSLAEAFYQGLSREPGIQLIERIRLKSLLEELQFQHSGLMDEAAIQRLGRLLGVEALVLGSISVIGREARLDGRIVSVETGLVLTADEASGPVEGLFELEDQLVSRTLSRWKMRERPTAAGIKRGEAEPGIGKATPPRWAVLPLEDLAGTGPGSEGEGIAQGIATRLAKTGRVAVVERKGGLPGTAGGGAGKPIVDPGRLTGADALLVGSYLRLQGRLKIHLRLLNTEFGTVIAAVTVMGSGAEPGVLTDRLADRILGEAGPGP